MTDKLNNTSSESVEKATGRGWDEWLALLDGDNATTLAHPDIAILLQQKYGVADWWCQMVTVGYEQARGLRVKGQAADGFQLSVNKTVNVPVKRLWEAFAVDDQRALWIGDGKVHVTKATEPKSVRMRWDADDSSVSINFYSKGENKSSVSIDHGKLPTSESADAMKIWWKDAVERMVQTLDGK